VLIKKGAVGPRIFDHVMIDAVDLQRLLMQGLTLGGQTPDRAGQNGKRERNDADTEASRSLIVRDQPKSPRVEPPGEIHES
jgi:hypothetical protein